MTTERDPRTNERSTCTLTDDASHHVEVTTYVLPDGFKTTALNLTIVTNAQTPRTPKRMFTSNQA